MTKKVETIKLGNTTIQRVIMYLVAAIMMRYQVHQPEDFMYIYIYISGKQKKMFLEIN